jgi:hypothetical protein
MLFPLNSSGVSPHYVVPEERTTCYPTQTEFLRPELSSESDQSQQLPNRIDCANDAQSRSHAATIRTDSPDFLRPVKNGARYNSRAPAQRNREPKRSAAIDYDPLLPVQYYESVVGAHIPSGEFRLFLAILEDALRCYVRTKNCRSGAQRAEFLDASNWFYEPSTAHVFSFESVCAFLDLDAKLAAQEAGVA